jgi:IS5 family transposase
MKMHIGVDSRTGLAHRAVVTPANVHDKHPLPDLLHRNERRVYGDSAYASQKALIESKAPQAREFTNLRVSKAGEIDKVERSKIRNTSKVRTRVEHVFALSNDYGALPRCATAGWPRTPPARSWSWAWPISTWRDSVSRHECARCGRQARLSH